MAVAAHHTTPSADWLIASVQSLRRPLSAPVELHWIPLPPSKVHMPTHRLAIHLRPAAHACGHGAARVWLWLAD